MPVSSEETLPTPQAWRCAAATEGALPPSPRCKSPPPRTASGPTRTRSLGGRRGSSHTYLFFPNCRIGCKGSVCVWGRGGGAGNEGHFFFIFFFKTPAEWNARAGRYAAMVEMWTLRNMQQQNNIRYNISAVKYGRPATESFYFYRIYAEHTDGRCQNTFSSSGERYIAVVTSETCFHIARMRTCATTTAKIRPLGSRNSGRGARKPFTIIPHALKRFLGHQRLRLGPVTNKRVDTVVNPEVLISPPFRYFFQEIGA